MKRLCCLLVLALTACPEKKAAPEPVPPVPESAKPAAGFWDWFKQNEAPLAKRASGEKAVALMNEIGDHLEKEHPALVAEIDMAATSPKPTLVITAGGDFKRFEEVKQLVAAAPPLSTWKVVAFRQRRSPDLLLQFDGKKVGVDQYFFRESGTNKGKLDLELLIKGYTEANAKELEKAGFLFLDVVLGEYDTETKVGAIDFGPLPAKPGNDVKPLVELAKRVDSLKEQP